MRGIVNSGWMKLAASVLRTEGEGSNRRPRRFSTWAAKAIATIKRVAETLMDRGVIVKLQRKAPGKSVGRFGMKDTAELAELRRKVARWTADNVAALTGADPEIPEALANRPADNWRPLIAVADHAGGTWPAKARKAALTLAGIAQAQDNGALLLRDIRRVFEESGNREFLGAEELVEKIVALPETPWAEWRRGQLPITSRGVAVVLEPFELRSDDSARPRRWWRERFEPVWKAYSEAE